MADNKDEDNRLLLNEITNNDDKEINHNNNNNNDEFEYPSDFDPNDYDCIDFNKEDQKQMLLILNKIIPDLNTLNSFDSFKSSNKQSKILKNYNFEILTRLTCLIKFFNDFFRPQEIWPLLGTIPISLNVDRMTKSLKFKEELNDEKIYQLNKYIHCWLYLFYTCDEIIESIDIVNYNIESMEMLTILILNIFSHIRDSLPQIRRIFLDYWYPLEKFEQKMECFFRYDKLYQIIMKQLVQERLMSQVIREQHSLMKKMLDTKQEELDKLNGQLQQQQQLQSSKSKTFLRKNRINLKPNQETTSSTKPLLSIQNHQQQQQQPPKSQLKSILLSQQTVKSPAPPLLSSSDSCASNSAYSSGPSSPQTLIIKQDTKQNKEQPQQQQQKPTQLELAEAVANKIHQTRCTTSKAKAESSILTTKSDSIYVKYPVRDIRRGRPRKLSSHEDSDDNSNNNDSNTLLGNNSSNKKTRLSSNSDNRSKIEEEKKSIQEDQDCSIHHYRIRPRKRFKMNKSLLKLESTTNNNNNNNNETMKKSITVNAISQQQIGPLKPIVKMNSSTTTMTGSKSLLCGNNNNNNIIVNEQCNNNKSKSLIIKPLKIKMESSTNSSNSLKMKINTNTNNDKIQSNNCLKLLPELDNLTSFYRIDLSNNNRYKCLICSINNESMDKFLKHLAIHVENDDVYQCNVCTKIFPNQYKLNRHYHQEEKGHFLCKICMDIVFPRQHLLNEHMETMHPSSSSSSSSLLSSSLSLSSNNECRNKQPLPTANGKNVSKLKTTLINGSCSNVSGKKPDENFEEILLCDDKSDNDNLNNDLNNGKNDALDNDYDDDDDDDDDDQNFDISSKIVVAELD